MQNSMQTSLWKFWENIIPKISVKVKKNQKKILHQLQNQLTNLLIVRNQQTNRRE